jgi:hypothetical protein
MKFWESFGGVISFLKIYHSTFAKLVWSQNVLWSKRRCSWCWISEYKLWRAMDSWQYLNLKINFWESFGGVISFLKIYHSTFAKLVWSQNVLWSKRRCSWCWISEYKLWRAMDSWQYPINLWSLFSLLRILIAFQNAKALLIWSVYANLVIIWSLAIILKEDSGFWRYVQDLYCFVYGRSYLYFVHVCIRVLYLYV